MKKELFAISLLGILVQTKGFSEPYDIDRLPFPEDKVYMCTQNGNGDDDPSHKKNSTKFDLDLGLTEGSKVIAVHSGYALYKFDDVWGRVIRIYHTNNKDVNKTALQNDGFFSIYAHLSKSNVKEAYELENAQWVEKGEIIGLSGCTGTSCDGAHLHFGIHKPSAYFAGESVPMRFKASEYRGKNPNTLVRSTFFSTGPDVANKPAGKRKGVYCMHEPKRFLQPGVAGDNDNDGYYYGAYSDNKDEKFYYYNGLAWRGSYACQDQRNEFFEAEKRDGGIFLTKNLSKDMCISAEVLCDQYDAPRECTAEKPIEEFDGKKE